MPLRPLAPPHRRTARGFTLIELMVVMSLITILASIGLTVYANSVTRAKEAVLKEDLYRMRQAIDQYYADKNRYPEAIEALVADKYLREIPVDPFTSSATTWQTVQADIDPSNISAGPGIYDVHSGAPGVGLDGTNYSEW